MVEAGGVKAPPLCGNPYITDIPRKKEPTEPRKTRLQLETGLRTGRIFRTQKKGPGGFTCVFPLGTTVNLVEANSFRRGGTIGFDVCLRSLATSRASFLPVRWRPLLPCLLFPFFQRLRPCAQTRRGCDHARRASAGDSGRAGSEVGSGEGTAEESPPAGRVTDETDYLRLADYPATEEFRFTYTRQNRFGHISGRGLRGFSRNSIMLTVMRQLPRHFLSRLLGKTDASQQDPASASQNVGCRTSA
jgi:hypothetical protein